MPQSHSPFLRPEPVAFDQETHDQKSSNDASYATSSSFREIPVLCKDISTINTPAYVLH
jgi:hypothetical protein